ncbi:unnamed protein product [Dibothriocephalus latus]|uniref:Uncharacterized protein n=1 Tax=Dibothriocephalus latus TaxID=60516 RepID=A0A3P7PEV8_DIBLA|nr:unnamed protein product [Dibothriocephalus latus]
MNRMEGTKKTNARPRRNDDAEHFDARFKIVLLGESGVGKTSLIRSAMGQDFNPSMISTIEFPSLMIVVTAVKDDLYAKWNVHCTGLSIPETTDGPC